MRTLSLTLLLAMGTTWACVTTASQGSSGSGSDRNLITRAQLESIPSLSAYEAVERYHRDWLRGRSGTVRSDTGRSYPQVFVDGRPYGAIEALHQFTADTIEKIQFISAPDATTRYGTGYPGGIIDLVLRRRSPTMSHLRFSVPPGHETFGEESRVFPPGLAG
jgi:hypothetical protein